MAKKKKTALKPVARGFATTSVPKKVTEPDPVEDSPPAADSDAGQAEAQGSNVVAADGAANNGTTSQAKGPLLNPEEQFFQDLIDKLQEKTEREIVRNIKVRTKVGYLAGH
jgi:ATP-dependent RNA helicase DHX29